MLLLRQDIDTRAIASYRLYSPCMCTARQSSGCSLISILAQHRNPQQARDKEYLRRCFMAGEGHCSPRASGETGGSAAIGVPASSGRGSADSGGGSGAFLGFSTSPRHRDASPRGRTATPSPRDTAGAPPPNAAPAPLSIKAAASAALGHASTSGIAAIRVPPPPPLMMPGGSASGGGCEPMAARVVSSWHFDPVLVHEVRTAASTSLPSSPRSQQPRSPLGVTSHLGQCDAAAGEGATARSDCCTGAGISQDGSSSHAPRHRCHSDELSQALLGRLSPEGSSRSADGTGHDSGSGAVGGWGWLAERLKLGPKSLRGSGVGSAGSGAGGGGGSSDGASSGSAAAGSLRTSPRVSLVRVRSGFVAQRLDGSCRDTTTATGCSMVHACHNGLCQLTFVGAAAHGTSKST